MPKPPWYFVTLDCGHTMQTQHFSYALETRFCNKCFKERNVIACELDDYNLRCTDCKYARHFGINRTNAFSAARRHSRLHNHKVHLLWGDTESIHWYDGRITNATLDDVPPF